MRHFSLMGALIAMAGMACASTTYNFSGTYTVFNGSGASGVAESATGGEDTFTLTYSIPGSSSPNTVSSYPSNINLGNFTLSCSGTCDGTVVSFPAFTFVITLNDTTDGGSGTFTGTSSGGSVSDNGSSASSNISIAWAPLQLGPNANNATSGNFGTTFFTISSPTLVVDPITNGGLTSLQGQVSSSAVPEPMSFGLVGLGLVTLGVTARRRTKKQ